MLGLAEQIISDKDKIVDAEIGEEVLIGRAGIVDLVGHVLHEKRIASDCKLMKALPEADCVEKFSKLAKRSSKDLQIGN